MEVTDTIIDAVKIVTLMPHMDSRGLFVETFDSKAFADLGIKVDFVQDALSVNARAGTLRGLHYQTPPHERATMVRVMRGRIFDVAVDLRKASPTFGMHVSAELSARDWRCLFIPSGFAHGFCTLEDDTEVAYKLSDHYAPDSVRGIDPGDPELCIAWPTDPSTATRSSNDLTLPKLSDIESPFLMKQSQEQ